MFEPKTKEINGIKFKVVPLPAVKALRLKNRLLKIFGPAIGRLLGSFEGIGDENVSVADVKVKGLELGNALETLFLELTEDEFINLLKVLLDGVSCEITVNGKEVLVNFNENFDEAMDLVFQGKLFTIYPVIGFVLEVNFPDFFASMLGIGSRLITTMSKRLKENDEKY